MNLDLGLVKVLGADAVGRPGQRRFRLFMQSARGSAVMWMEKEQLSNLAQALDRLLAQVTQGQQVLRVEAQAGGLPAPEGMPGDFPRTPNYDFQVGQMRLNFDEENEMFMLSATPLEVMMERGQEPQVRMDEDSAISFIFTQQVAQSLSSSITLVISAGRPVCPLCRTPLDGSPHACVKQNGHYQIIQVEEEE